MSRRISRGFTLVELLVVITIIGMLAALLIPAVNAARETGRRAVCMNNLKNLSLGVTQFSTAKDRLPGWRNLAPSSSSVVLGWVPSILPYIERNDIYQQIASNVTSASPPSPLIPDLTIDTLVCPSDFEAVLNESGTHAQLSYQVNGGLSDVQNISNTLYGSPYVPPPDRLENGVFFDAVPTVKAGSANLNRVKISMSDIGGVHDGLAMTIMLSENVDAGVWTDVGAYNNSASPDTVSGPSEISQAILWEVNSDFPTGSSPPYTYKSFAQYFSPTNSPAPITPTARPKSGHTTPGFHVAFCDGHCIFMSTGIDYLVYCRLMTSYGLGCHNLIAAVQPAATANLYNFQQSALSEDDLNK